MIGHPPGNRIRLIIPVVLCVPPASNGVPIGTEGVVSVLGMAVSVMVAEAIGVVDSGKAEGDRLRLGVILGSVVEVKMWVACGLGTKTIHEESVVT